MRNPTHATVATNPTPVLAASTVPLRNRTVYIAFDSDQADNPNVRRAALRLYNELLRHGAIPKILCLPPDKEGKKQGLDDFLANRAAADVYALPVLDASTVGAEVEEEREGSYRIVDHAVKLAALAEMELEAVPQLGTLVLNYSVDELVAFSEGTSVLNPQVQREGVVLRPLVEEHDEGIGGRLSFKAINPKFLLKYDE